MPARKVTRVSKADNTIQNISNEVVGEKPLVFEPSLGILAPVPRSVEMMEKVKSRIESFDNNGQANLLKQILELYASSFSCADTNRFKNIERTLELFRTQITENGNGIFLNLTSCSDELWNTCVYCVNRLERQANDLEKLDRERAAEVAKLKKTCKVTKVRLATTIG
jgi:hypothetical protein